MQFVQSSCFFIFRVLKQERQYKYNVTSRRFIVTNLAVQKQQVLHILSVCL